jgi:hypothetical protein
MIFPGSGLRENVHEMSVNAPPDQVGEWAGLSGAPVFCGNYLVSIIQVAVFGGNRLRAIPSERLFADTEFRSLLGAPTQVSIPASLAHPIEARGMFKSVPRLPSALVHRDSLELQALQSIEDAVQNLGLTVLVGPPGVGKTTLAATVISNLRQYHGRFNEFLWATFGQQPDNLTIVRQWLLALGEGGPTTNLACIMHER